MGQFVDDDIRDLPRSPWRRSTLPSSPRTTSTSASSGSASSTATSTSIRPLILHPLQRLLLLLVGATSQA
ncbi:hypothetical protein ZEAMMB73_Zm00001d032085 [Zea mays]|uniref:Uncharacterized protein n=1 Tax=Zea mays TaxID=4577 RepID=A0A1D6KNF4_MAIZE|nr:hypothetical protein ZEAMMB73_Zm00001d032085 [Zea mays]